MEVKGFLSGQTWYSDPLNPDTNNDGLVDAQECPERVRASATSLSPATACRDTDNDGTPDIFDRDNDDDGVPDRIDLAPNKALGYDKNSTGKSNPASSERRTPFTRDDPFKLVVDSLQKDTAATAGGNGYPVFVDFQLHPTEKKHLTYARNVLDWPSGDEEGQIQRTTDTTFAQFMDPQPPSDDPSWNGDVRLVPMLEIKMSGATIPLPFTAPSPRSVQFEGRNEDSTRWISATVTLTPQSTSTKFSFRFEDTTTVDAARLYKGLCGQIGDKVTGGEWQNVSSGASQTLSGHKFLTVVDGAHAIVLEKGSLSACANLGDLPNGPYSDKVIDLEKLQTHGISVRDISNQGTAKATLAAYLPLNVVKDETGGANVAFSARMLYWPNDPSKWGNAHEVRVVWLVQLLDDNDQTQIVHTYGEEWRLAGLSVREDHGMTVAIAYEDPSKDDDRKADDRLWQVARGLDAGFTSGRKNSQGQRDLTIAGFKARFDNTSDSTAAKQARWGIPGGKVVVTTKTYVHQDYLAMIPMELAPGILKQYFTPYKDQGADAPTLLFAREEHYRTASLDMAGGVATVSGSQLKVTLDPTKCSLDVLASINWAPYRYEDGQWQAYPLDDYWDKMSVRFKAQFQDRFQQDPPEYYKDAAPADKAAVIDGLVAATQSFYIGMAYGTSSVVQTGPNVLRKRFTVRTDVSLARKFAEYGGDVLQSTAETVVETFYDMMDELAEAGAQLSKMQKLQEIGSKGFLGGSRAEWAGMTRGGKAKAVGGLVGSAALSVGLFIGADVLGVPAVDYIGKALEIISAVKDLVDTIKEIRSVITGVTGFTSKMAAMGKSISSASQKAGIVGLVISVGVAVGVFIASMVAAGITFGGLAFNAALAGMIAGVITSVIMFAIALIPIVGQIIAAVIAVLDALVAGICAIVDAVKDKDVNDQKWSERGFGKWFCKGVTGLVSEFIKWAIYSQTILVGNMEEEDRTKTWDFKPSLTEGSQGYAVGSGINYSMKVASSITLADVAKDWKAAAYAWQYNYKNLDSATFKYALQIVPLDLPVSRNEMEEDWKLADGSRPSTFSGGRLYMPPQEISTVSPLLAAGINRPALLYLTEAYAVPVQECWAIISPPPFPPCPFYPCIPVCYIRTKTENNPSNIGEKILWDVFPATLDGFYEPVTKDSGYSLAWGQSGDVTFPRMKDFDGDGLLNKADGGNDPNDREWDTDADGLSDAFELQRGANPESSDSDGDTVSDHEEILRGSNPNRKDSDGDGLTDGEEVFHQRSDGTWVGGWELVYGFSESGSQLRTWVSADPLVVDADNDQLTDFQERVFGFSPWCKSDPHVLNYESEVREEGAPVMLLRFEEMSGATLFGDVSGYTNNGTCVDYPCPVAGHTGRYGNALTFDGVDDTVHVNMNAPAGDFTLAAWVKYTGSEWSGWHTIMEFGSDSPWFGVRYDGSLSVYPPIGGGPDIEGGRVEPGEWTHVAYTWNGTKSRLYVNGEQKAEITSEPRHTGSKLRIGHYNDTAWKGQLDEVAIFAKALSQTEIQKVMAARYNPNDMIVAPDDTLAYEATLKNKMLNRYTNGLLSTDVSDDLVSAVPPTTFTLHPTEKKTMSGAVTVADTAASGAYNLTQKAGAIVVDRREESSPSGRDTTYAELWLPFDEEAGATTFKDTSGNFPSRDATCSGSSCPQAGISGTIGRAVRFDGANDHVQVPHHEAFDFGSKGDFSVSLWVKTSGAGEYGTLIAKKDWRSGSSKGFVLSGSGDGDEWYANVADGSDRVDIDGSTINDNQWHHLAVTFDRDGYMVVYQDGTEMGRKSLSKIDNINNKLPLVIGDDSSFSYPFNGLIDDVRIYPTVLSQDDINLLYGRPVLQLGFEERDGKGNSFGSGGYYCPFPGVCLPVPVQSGAASCVGSRCPKVLKNSIVGQGGNFYGDDYLSVSSGALDLTNKRFTISLWVYPQDRSDSDYNNYTQGLLGRYYGDDNAYPSLAIKSRDLIFGFGNDEDNKWYERTASGVINREAWNHVVATLEGSTLRLYVNGEPVSTTGDSLSAAIDDTFSTPQIGRASNWFGFQIRGLKITDVDDEGSNNTVELCMTWNGKEVFNQGKVDPTGWLDIMKTMYGYDSGKLTMWEDDGGTRCGSKPDDADDSVKTWTFDTNTPHSSYTKDGYYYIEGKDFRSSNVDGTLYIGRHNPSIPLYGYMDEVAIYKRPLNAEEVQTLYQAGTTVLHLPFDDAPGAGLSPQGFVNTMDFSRQSNGKCSGDACPTTGVTGRANQAALFDGDDQVDVPVSVPDRDFTLAAWVKYTGSNPGNYNTIMEFGNDAPGLFMRGDRSLHLYPRIQGGTIPPNTWTHVAYVWDGDYSELYINGERVKRLDTSAPPRGAGLGIGHHEGETAWEGYIDDVKVYRRALSGNEVRDLYRAAPQLVLHLDEPVGATTFKDDSGGSYNGTCTGARCPKSGVKGQIGLAAQFDGNDYILVQRDASTGNFTLMAWIKYSGGEKDRYRTIMEFGNDSPLFSVHEGKLNLYNAASGGTVPIGQWAHVAYTWDGSHSRLYLNGYQVADPTTTAPPVGGEGLAIGKGTDAGWIGRIDEPTIYERALSEYEIRDVFRYQARWIEERQSQDITIDAADPTSSLTSYVEGQDNYRPNEYKVTGVVAQDAASSVPLVELGVKGPGESAFTWQAASPCLDATSDSAWCPGFDPLQGAGVYQLQTRATDAVGHRETPARTYTLYVDGAQPTVSTTIQNGALLSAQPHPTLEDTWLLSLSGTVSDPVLPGGHAGSGVAPESVRVTLLDADGDPAGDGPQAVTINDSTWALDYVFSEASPTGPYTLHIEAEDGVGNQTSTDLVTLQVDATAPSAELTLPLPPQDARLHLRLDDPAGSTTFENSVVPDQPGTCSGSTCPTAGVSGKYGYAAQFDGTDDYLTLSGSLDFAKADYSVALWFKTSMSSTQDLLAATNPSGDAHGILLEMGSDGKVRYLHRFPTGVSGGTSIYSAGGYNNDAWHYLVAVKRGANLTLYLDGAIAGTSTDSHAPDYALDITLGRVSKTGSSRYFNGLLDDVRIFNRALGLAEIRALMQEPDPVLHLRLDEGAGATAFADSSGNENHGTCSGDACPTAGVSGKYGQALSFDGNDIVTIKQGSSFAAGLPERDITVAAWVYLNSYHGWGGYVSAVQHNGGFQKGWVLGNYDHKFSFALSTDGADDGNGVLTYLKAEDTFATGRWYHVAATYDGETMRLYVDGVLKNSSTAKPCGSTWMACLRTALRRNLATSITRPAAGSLWGHTKTTTKITVTGDCSTKCVS